MTDSVLTLSHATPADYPAFNGTLCGRRSLMRSARIRQTA